MDIKFKFYNHKDTYIIAFTGSNEYGRICLKGILLSKKPVGFIVTPRSYYNNWNINVFKEVDFQDVIESSDIKTSVKKLLIKIFQV